MCKYVCMFILTSDLFSGLVGRNCLCVSTHSDRRPVFGSCRQKVLMCKYVCTFILTGDLFSGLVGRNRLCVSTCVCSF